MLLKGVAVCGVVQTDDGVCSVVTGVSISKLRLTLSLPVNQGLNQVNHH